ncbi:MAG: polysaccharide deacetylase family protein [Clostridia bacterium]|nr:polysaccharide deacetylase family protein [Clostridia bacterium]
MKYQFMRFPGGKAKAVTLSYDDGCREDLQFAEIISRHGFKCTFNLNGDGLKGDRAFSRETIEENFLSKGHEVAVHGYFHRAEGTLRPIEGIQDVLNCRLELEHKVGRIIRGMAYPNGGITRFSNGASYDRVKQYLTDLDIAYARSLGGDNGLFRMPTDWHNWIPTAHHDNPKLFDYIDSFLNQDLSPAHNLADRHPRLFYLWGHAFEFARNKNWDRLDEICEKLGGKDEVWYATNIEIYDYTKAYESLIYSADGKMIYNPTVTKIWFDVDGTEYTIEPGQTITLDI